MRVRIVRRAAEAVLGECLADAARFRIDRESEVEHCDPAFGRDEYVLCLGAGLRAGLYAAGTSAQATYFATPTRLDAVLVGAVLAAAQREPPIRAWLARWGSLLGGLAALVIVVSWLLHRSFDPHQATTVLLGYTAVAVASGALLHAALRAQAAGTRGARWLRAPAPQSLGKYSYALYLFNLPVFTSVHQLVPAGAAPTLALDLVQLLVGGSLSLRLGLGSFHGLEKHALRLRRAFPWARPVPAAARSTPDVAPEA